MLQIPPILPIPMWCNRQYLFPKPTCALSAGMDGGKTVNGCYSGVVMRRYTCERPLKRRIHGSDLLLLPRGVWGQYHTKIQK
jgi:hypothetical protein